jgi:hypothetical protein
MNHDNNELVSFPWQLQDERNKHQPRGTDDDLMMGSPLPVEDFCKTRSGNIICDHGKIKVSILRFGIRGITPCSEISIMKSLHGMTPCQFTMWIGAGNDERIIIRASERAPYREAKSNKTLIDRE